MVMMLADVWRTTHYDNDDRVICCQIFCFVFLSHISTKRFGGVKNGGRFTQNNGKQRTAALNALVCQSIGASSQYENIADAHVIIFGPQSSERWRIPKSNRIDIEICQKDLFKSAKLKQREKITSPFCIIYNCCFKEFCILMTKPDRNNYF